MHSSMTPGLRATVLSLLCGLTAAWTRDDPCPTEIRVTIPNYAARDVEPGGVSRFHYFDGSIDDFSRSGDGNADHYEPPRGLVFATVAEVHDCLVACHANVTALNLRTTLLGCTSWPDRDNLPFDLAGTDKFPTLEELALEGYDFNQREWDQVKPKREFEFPAIGDVVDVAQAQVEEYEAKKTHPPDYDDSWITYWGFWFWSGKGRRFAKWRHLPEEQRVKTNLELWLDVMDFSKLRALALRDDGMAVMEGDTVMKRLPEALKGLRSLNITGAWQQGSEEEQVGWPAKDFILNLSPEATLTHFSGLDTHTCDAEVVDAILQRHGPSLTSLEWSTSEMETDARPAFSAGQLRNLSSLAPNLQSLTLDMNRKREAWPEEDLKALVAGLPSLTDLTIYWELASECRRAGHEQWYSPDSCDDACRGLDQLASPRLDLQSGETLFQLLRSAKAAGDELTKVVFRAGDFSRRWDGPLYLSPWLENRNVWVECSVLRENGTRKSEGEAVCHGQDRSLDRIDEKWIEHCGSERICKPRKNAVEAGGERQMQVCKR